jgi:hypothetical protein
MDAEIAAPLGDNASKARCSSAPSTLPLVFTKATALKRESRSSVNSAASSLCSTSMPWRLASWRMAATAAGIESCR